MIRNIDHSRKFIHFTWNLLPYLASIVYHVLYPWIVIPMVTHSLSLFRLSYTLLFAIYFTFAENTSATSVPAAPQGLGINFNTFCTVLSTIKTM